MKGVVNTPITSVETSLLPGGSAAFSGSDRNTRMSLPK
jgi:hypothetical protein